MFGNAMVVLVEVPSLVLPPSYSAWPGDRSTVGYMVHDETAGIDRREPPLILIHTVLALSSVRFRSGMAFPE